MKKFVLVMLCGMVLSYLTGCVHNNELNEDTKTTHDMEKSGDESHMYIKVNDKVLTVTLEQNSTVDLLLQKLRNDDITISMEEYGGFEKVGSLGFDLPTNDKQITTSTGDIVLYQGNSITIHYGENSWSYTRIGKVDNTSREELENILGDGEVTVTFSLNQ